MEQHRHVGTWANDGIHATMFDYFLSTPSATLTPLWTPFRQTVALVAAPTLWERIAKWCYDVLARLWRMS